MKRFLQFFEESPGRLSATRLVFILWTLMVGFIYCYRALNGEELPLPQSLDVLGMATILGGLKYFQKGQEIKNGNGKAVEKPPLP